MSRRNSLIRKPLLNDAESLKPLLLVLVFAPGFLSVGHDTDDLCPKFLHSGYGSLNFPKCDVEVVGDLLGPIPNERSNLRNFNFLFFEELQSFVEILVTKVMDAFAINGTR